MKAKIIYTLLAVAVCASLVFTLAAGPLAASPVKAEAPDTWYGAWQAGPDLDTALLGCNAGDGFARYTGIYNPSDNRIYFLGGRCENNNTTGTVFFFDMTSRTYAVSGATMPTPVSNYQVVAVPDDGAGNGVGYYLIGGRNNAGVNTNTVQVYYPGNNTVATIATDPFPPGGGAVRTPGGVVYANGKIYAFGGFDGVVMYDETYVYDPAAVAGSRWTNLNADLPTARSYIAAVAVGNLIYAMGGDEFTGGSLVPIDDTLVLDVSAGTPAWNDAAVADMPQANGDAPAVYVNQGYLGGAGGGIFVIGGYWPSPGPYRWVFRYDVVTNTWESFPDLMIPDPSTGRRNQAAVYVTAPTGEGLGNGQPGLWTFGGYDGSGTNAMTVSSEFFSVNVNNVLVMPETTVASGIPGVTVPHNFHLINLTGSQDTFDLSVTSPVTWTVSLPASVGPVAAGGDAPFTMNVTIPPGVPCGSTTGQFTVTAVSQANPSTTDSQIVYVDAVCGVAGQITDANNGSPLEGAYVVIQDSEDGLGPVFLETYTDGNGNFSFLNVPPGHYWAYASRLGYQPSFYPDGWPLGAIEFDIAGTAAYFTAALVSPLSQGSPTSFDVSVEAGQRLAQTLTITNTGTGPLFFAFDKYDGGMTFPPPPNLPVPGLPRIDPQIAQDLQASPDGRTEFVVVLESQANLGAADSISDWNARGEYVLERLRSHAEFSQRGLRAALGESAADVQSLYIINAMIVRNADQALLDRLAARPDVAQIVANHRIPIEKQAPAGPTPDAIGWNISKINADDVWTAYGNTGQGAVVAEIDSGTEWDHPALQPHYRGWNGATADHNYNWWDPYGTSSNEPADADGHGTHVMGTMVGDDGAANQIGVAPGAKWISCDGGDDASGYLFTTELLECAQWILAPWDLNGLNPDPAMRPHVVNNSWGGSPNDYWYTGAIDAWRAAGIFPQFANGNAGPNCGTAHSPGDNVNAFAAGASDQSDNIAGFSSRGPSQFWGFHKPNITAPGVAIRSSVPGGGYALYNGTSMASPHVAGSVALLWANNPELIGQIDLTAWVLQSTAANVIKVNPVENCGGIPTTQVPNNTYGWGLVDIKAAVDRAKAGGVTPGWLSTDPTGGEVPPGASLDVSVEFAPTLGMSGVYTASLFLTTNEAHPPYILPVTMTVTVEPPVAEFTSTSPDVLGDVTTFTDASTGTPPLTYAWDFGDSVTSTLPSPTHTFAALGTYTVTLTVSNSVGVDTVSHPVVIEAPVATVAEFSSNSPAPLGQDAVFTDLSTGNAPLTYLWDFGDTYTSTLQNPVHTYAAVGAYTVTLTVSGPGGSDSVTHTFEVYLPGSRVFLPYLSRD
jgi:PKD repeat protein